MSVRFMTRVGIGAVFVLAIAALGALLFFKIVQNRSTVPRRASVSNLGAIRVQ